MNPGELLILACVVVEAGLILGLAVHFAKRLEKLEGDAGMAKGKKSGGKGKRGGCG